MKVLLVGLGYTSRRLAEELVLRGHEVVGLCRSPVEPLRGVRVEHGDATDPSTFTSLPRDFDALVLALSAGERSESAYRRTYLAAAETARSAFPNTRLLFVSSTAVYAERDGEPVDDDTPPRPDTATARVLFEAEQAASRGPCLVVRPSGIYGPGRTALLQRLLAGGIAQQEENVWTSRIHRDDLALALAFCIERPDLEGSLLASDPEPAQLGAMQEWIRAQLETREGEGVPPIADAAAIGSRARTQPGTEKPRREEPRRSRRIQATRLASLGFAFRYPSYREGYAREIYAELLQKSSRAE